MIGLSAATAIALPLAGASAGPVGDAGRMVARMSGLTEFTDFTHITEFTEEKARTDDLRGRAGGAPEHDSRPYGAGDGALRQGGARGDGTREDWAHSDGGPAGETWDGETGRDGALGGEVRGEEGEAASRSPLALGTGLATVTRCGPDLSSPYGIEAQTCVLTRGEETWARTYHRNATGEELTSVLSLMTPDGRSVRMRCVVDAQNEPGVCETPRKRTRGDLDGYTAVAEFAASHGRGPLLLRSGSNSPRVQGG